MTMNNFVLILIGAWISYFAFGTSFDISTGMTVGAFLMWGYDKVWPT